jgi:hypothetical protein
MAMRGARGVSKGERRERRSVEFADAPDGKPHAREASERVDGRVEASRRALERATVEDVRSETSSRGEPAGGRAAREERASDAYTRSSELSDGEYTYTPTSTSERSSAFSASEPWSDVGPGAPFPETFEAREARLLGKLNAAMTTTMRYWDREEEMAHTKPVPEFEADDDSSLAARRATAAAWAAPSDDEHSVGADADGSLSGDSGDRVFDELGDFESAHDLATPWNDRPKVIARRIVRHIVNRALREKFPPKPSFANDVLACFGCAAPEERARARRRARRRDRHT